MKTIYNPQKTDGKPWKKNDLRPHRSAAYHNIGAINRQSAGGRYPKSIIRFSNGNNDSVHPTQKPVALYEYLILTYTNPGDTVLDFCAGSGTTGVAAIETGRNAILIEKDPTYFEIMTKRIEIEQSQMRLPLYETEG